MKTQWQTVIKPAFLQDVCKLAGKDVLQIMEKIEALAQDPQADGKVKKHLIHCPGRPYRIRSGDYRIFYTYNKEVVCIYKIDRRDEGTYKECPEAEYALDDIELSDLDTPSDSAITTSSTQPDWERIFAKQEGRSLPEPITVELLKKLHIQPAYQQRLLRITNEDDLLSCPGIDEDTLLKIDHYMFERSLIEIMQEPDLVLSNVDDLLRYKEGELLDFLLRLSPEQEKYASWSLNTAGPTLVKGGPGTGKSTVAFYRIRSLLDQLLKLNKGRPRILFTTYTNALVNSSKQQLDQLLGPHMPYVQVDTADSIAYSILNNAKQLKQFEIFENQHELYKITRQACAETGFAGNLLQQQAQKQTLEHMGVEYLLQEFNSVIIARQINTLAEYQQTARAGRKLRLNATQRSAVWLVYQQWRSLLLQAGKETWELRRARAEPLAEASPLFRQYDAVIIDEAQDIDPSLLRLLIKLCKAPNRIFVTADANQSIYGSGFAWSDVHACLKFQGRTSILRANYRSTSEVGEAAQSYLTSGMLEPEVSERQYINSGPLPDARTILNSAHEAPLLASYFKKACGSLRLTAGSCAILCPTDYAGRALASSLSEQGLDATFMTGRTLDLSRPGVKVITLKSSKGLEFPIVALAGFASSNYPSIPAEASGEEIEELLARERRTLFVGMTRAMRALLVVLPHNATSPLLQGFDASHWNFSRNI